jgi:arsenate reductase (glutaredoxin)
MDVQLFGLAKSKATRKAQRFFSERGVPVHFVDLTRRTPAPGELRKWIQRFGVEGVLDADSKAYREQGLRYVSASADDWTERLSRDPSPLRLPLARCGRDLAVGDDPQAWQRFADTVKNGS